MPFYCGYCSRWVESKHKFCPTCGRPKSGRLCRRCKSKVPNDATHCPSCGGNDRLTEPAVRGWRIPRRFRFLALGLIVVLGPLLLGWLAPFVKAVWFWLLHLAFQLALYVGAFWLLTALLPRALGQKIRRAVWWTIRQVIRVAGNLWA